MHLLFAAAGGGLGSKRPVGSGQRIGQTRLRRNVVGRVRPCWLRLSPHSNVALRLRFAASNFVREGTKNTTDANPDKLCRNSVIGLWNCLHSTTGCWALAEEDIQSLPPISARKMMLAESPRKHRRRPEVLLEQHNLLGHRKPSTTTSAARCARRRQPRIGSALCHWKPLTWDLRTERVSQRCRFFNKRALRSLSAR